MAIDPGIVLVLTPDRKVADITWMTWNELPVLRSGDEFSTILQLANRVLDSTLTKESAPSVPRESLADVASELSLQWIAIVKRVPGPSWQTIAEHGQHTLEKIPVALWDESLDRESGGTAKLPNGWTAVAFPLTPPRSASFGNPQLLVGAGRSTSPLVSQTGLIAARALGLAMGISAQRGGLSREIERLRSTLEIASRLSAAEEADRLLDLIAEEATRLLECDRSSIFLFNRERNEVVARPALGVAGKSLRLPANEGIVGDTLKSAKAIRVDDAYSDPRFNREVDETSGYRTRTILSVPLLDADGSLVGAFQAINRNDEQPFTEDDEQCLQLLGTQAAAALRNIKERNVLSRSRDQLAEQVAGKVAIIGESPAIVALRDTIHRLSSTDLPVLVLGESGTGKEVVAQSLHYRGARADSPFVAVNCAALAESLLESELFGHEKGAFTDARETRQGKFELADGGTLFLDEIGDMSLGGQAKLLRVLEQKVITRVGGAQPIPINVRIVAATNARLSHLVRERKFREDLFYRLSVVTLELPPLRDRPEDILPLAEFFLKQFSAQANRVSMQLSSDARRRLQGHAWPGNIRELRNLMERVAFLAQADRVEADDLSFILSPEDQSSKLPPLDAGLDLATKQFQREFIRRCIDRVTGNMTDAAKLLGLHRSNLYRKMKQLEMNEVGGEE